VLVVIIAFAFRTFVVNVLTVPERTTVTPGVDNHEHEQDEDYENSTTIQRLPLRKTTLGRHQP
jgi:hypothetical protein